MRSSSKGKSLVSFDVALTRRNTGSDGEVRDEITFVPTICYAGQADVAQFFKKGELVLVAGRLEAARDGSKAILIVAETVQVLKA